MLARLSGDDDAGGATDGRADRSARAATDEPAEHVWFVVITTPHGKYKPQDGHQWCLRPFGVLYPALTDGHYIS